MKVNINNYIKVNLTAYGVDILTKYCNDRFKNFLSEKEILDYINSKFENGLLKIQMWEFCNVFGSHMFNGSKQLIHDNKIIINE